jgi:hypothetical protein
MSRVARPQVLSASRRTELLGHYPDAFAARLERIGPARVHTVVIWTKDPRHLLSHQRLRAALRGVGQVFLHWTVTGLGGTALEPAVPMADTQCALLPDIVGFLGDPRRLHWRYDPLITVTQRGERISNLDLLLFRRLAETFSGHGVPAVHVSFVTPYPKVRRRLEAAGVALELPEAPARARLLAGMEEAAAPLGLRLITCCEVGRPMGRCIDGELLSALHPEGAPCRTDRARGQRELCGCTASLDIGHYLPCPNRCLYCYAHPAAR